jgi:hypothetical protein
VVIQRSVPSHGIVRTTLIILNCSLCIVSRFEMALPRTVQTYLMAKSKFKRLCNFNVTYESKKKHSVIALEISLLGPVLQWIPYLMCKRFWSDSDCVSIKDKIRLHETYSRL